MAILKLQVGQKWLAVTPSDTVKLPVGCIGLYVGSTGDLSLVGNDGAAVTFASVPVGYYHLGVRRVNATATTADDIVAVYA